MTVFGIKWARILEIWFKMFYFYLFSYLQVQCIISLFNFLVCLQFLDNLHFYLPLDNSFIMDHFKSDVETLSHHWRMLGRPVIIFPVNRSMLGATGMVIVGFILATLLHSSSCCAITDFSFMVELVSIIHSYCCF